MISIIAKISKFKTIFSVVLVFIMIGMSVNMSFLYNTFVANAAGTDIYVSPTGSDTNTATISQPIQSLAKARDMVRSRVSTMTSNINVIFRGGTYYVPQTLNLTELDSGRNGFRVVWQSYPGEEAQLSGGRKIPGTWTMHDSTKNIYKIPLSNLNGITPRELFANGQRMQRAWTGDHTTGNNGINIVRDSNLNFNISGIDMSSWQNIGDTEVGILTEWASERCGVTSATATTIVMEKPCSNKWLISTSRNYSFFIENAYELINQNNEWYYNSSNSTMYIKMPSGVNPNSQSFVIPTTEKLMTINGSSASNKASNIDFKDLQFVYSAEFETNSNIGYRNYQCHIQWPIDYNTGDATRQSSAIRVKNADSINFQGNLFAHLAVQSLELEDGASNINITNNKFTDMSGGGIVVSNYERVNPINEKTRNILIKNNVIEKVAREYKAECGISIGFADTVTIESNEVIDNPYTAIAHWTLTSDKQFGASDIKNIVTTKNKITNYMNTMWDGGGVYYRAWSPGSSVDNNCLDNTMLTTQSYGGWISNAKHGLYVDEGSKDFVFDSNVVKTADIDRWFSAWNTNTELIRVTNNFSDTSKQLFTGSIVRTNNTVITNGVYPTAAQNIMAACGLDSSSQSVNSIDENLTATGQTIAFGQVYSGQTTSSAPTSSANSSTTSSAGNSSCGANSQEVVVNTRSRATARQSSPNANFNNATALFAAAGDQRYAYLDFYTPSLPAGNITSTSLRLQESLTNGSGYQNFEVRPVVASWSATTLTWNNKPAASSPVYGTQNFNNVNPTDGQIYNVPLSGITIGPASTYYFALVPIGSGNVDISFDSPQIVLCYASTNSSSAPTSSIASSTISSTPASSAASSIGSSSPNSSSNSSAGFVQPVLGIKVFLGGGFDPNTNLMKTNIRSSSKLPNAQPYNTSPWNYNGSESVNNINTLSSTTNVVDWILLEIRNSGNTVVERQATLLRNDGVLLDPSDQTQNITLRNITTNGNYQIIIRHRNHLAISTNNGVNFVSSGSSAMLDFTTTVGNNNVKNGNQIQVVSGIYALKAGNSNSDNSIDAADRNIIRTAAEGANIYNNKDLNLDGSVDAADRNLSRLATESLEII